jgi:Ulp1 family protease
MLTLPVMQATHFKHVYNPPGTPKQRNGFDCGVFAVMCCSYVGADLPFNYGQEQVYNFFRAMVALECFFQRLRNLG